MQNLHKFYYRSYFSNGGETQHLSFEDLILKEDAKRERDKDRKKKIEDKASKISKSNSEIMKVRNKILIGSDFVKKDQNGEPTQELLPGAKIDNDIATARISELKISYPGLVTGVGINHEAKIEGEFKLGVHFDYTYGMPVVYGSSVKGVLRSSFILREEHGRILEYEPYFLKQITGRDWSQDELKLLFESIFEGKEGGKTKSIYNRDIFFDAVITKADSKGRILCSDSITPHGANPLKNPTPITFLKIAPGCTMEFRFKLVDSEIDGKTFTADQKKALFEEIIKTVGVGAKTNVGYGQFE